MGHVMVELWFIDLIQIHLVGLFRNYQINPYLHLIIKGGDSNQ